MAVTPLAACSAPALDLTDYQFASTTTAFDQHSEPVMAAWNDPIAREKIERVFTNGMFAEAPAVAHLLCEILDTGLESGAAEESVLAELRRFVAESPACQSIADSYNRDETARIERRINQLCSALDRPSSFMDIGCGSGTITAGLARAWGLHPRDVTGLEIADRVEPNAAFTMIPMTPDGLVPEGVHADLAILLMVLHHEASAETLLASIYDAIPDGGHVLIRDHDAATESMKLFLTAFDRLYYSVFNGCEGVPEPANYQSLQDWLDIARDVGFSVEQVWYPEPDSPMSPVHILLNK
jgi:SAM-dependent methyltransferase